jgi:hypothetical protein
MILRKKKNKRYLNGKERDLNFMGKRIEVFGGYQPK